jgi:hypothetical protein
VLRPRPDCESALPARGRCEHEHHQLNARAAARASGYQPDAQVFQRFQRAPRLERFELRTRTRKNSTMKRTSAIIGSLLILASLVSSRSSAFYDECTPYDPNRPHPPSRWWCQDDPQSNATADLNSDGTGGWSNFISKSFIAYSPSNARIDAVVNLYTDGYPPCMVQLTLDGTSIATGTATPYKSSGASAAYATITLSAVAEISVSSHQILVQVAGGTSTHLCDFTMSGSRLITQRVR